MHFKLRKLEHDENVKPTNTTSTIVTSNDSDNDNNNDNNGDDNRFSTDYEFDNKMPLNSAASTLKQHYER